MLACNFKKDAVRYQKCFEQFGDLTTAVVISAPDMREGSEEVDESTDDMVVAFWDKMMAQYRSIRPKNKILHPHGHPCDGYG